MMVGPLLGTGGQVGRVDELAGSPARLSIPFERRAGVLDFRKSHRVPFEEVAVPPAKAVKAVFLFLYFADRELSFAISRSISWSNFAESAMSSIHSSRRTRANALHRRGVRLAVASCGEHGQQPTTSFCGVARSFEAACDGREVGQCPCSGADRNRTGSAHLNLEGPRVFLRSCVEIGIRLEA